MSMSVEGAQRKHGHVMHAVVLAALPVCALIFSMCAGRFAIPPTEVVLALVQAVSNAWCAAGTALFGVTGAGPGVREWVSADAYNVVVAVRLPRALAAIAVGAALAVSGAAYQGVFRNPLVNPGLLGVSSGASFGAALAIVLVGGSVLLYPLSFVFGIVAVVASYLIARVYKQTPTIMLILGGTIVSSVFSALVSLMKYVADPETQLPSIVYWLMGSLSSVSWAQLWALVPLLLGVVVLLGCARKVDVLSMGDKEARSLGLEVGVDKGLVVAAATLATASAVCMAGVVGWVGLIIPHIGRMIVGPQNARLLPACLSLGAAFMVVVDTAARCLWASEIPLGILTALIGAPFFVYLLKRTKGGVW